MDIWVDICHTPHVLLMEPLIREFERRGHSVLITARDCFQIGELLAQRNLSFSMIGRHYGGKKICKAFGLFARSLQLAHFAQKHRFQLSVSPGSPYQALASYLLRIPFVVINDYEHSSVFNLIRHIAHRLIFPEAVSDQSLQNRGIALKNVIKFKGLKEDIYLSDFQPDAGVIQELGLDALKNIIAVMRPSASVAHYHNPKSDQLILRILDYLRHAPNVAVVMLPRGEQQRRLLVDIKNNDTKSAERIIIPERAIDTLSLLYHADLMIGGGGTMNREAAALGIPTYSFFCGPTGDVDRALQQSGRLRFIRTEADIPSIKCEKKPNDTKTYQTNHLKSNLIEQILESLKSDG